MNVKEYLMPVIVLTVICLVITATLAYTNGVTEPIIERNTIEQANLTRTELIPEATGFEEITDAQLPEGVEDAYRETSGLGYVFTTVSKGYGGDYKVMTAISAEGTILGLKVTEQSETPGLGSKTTVAEYTDTYKGQGAALADVTSITGATVSSNALKTAVQTAFSAYSAVSGVSTEVVDDFRIKLFPEAQKFEKIEFGGAIEAYSVDDGQGYIVVSWAPGYFHVPMMGAVGFNPDGTIVGVEITYIDETEGLGTQVAEKEYLQQFVGKTDTQGVEVISGATVSSQALINLVQSACDEFAAAMKEAK